MINAPKKDGINIELIKYGLARNDVCTERKNIAGRKKSKEWENCSSDSNILTGRSTNIQELQRPNFIEYCLQNYTRLTILQKN